MKMPEEKSARGERFSADERDALYRVIAGRRDMRHFLPGTTIDEAVLQRLLQAAHNAPSVGLMQPWRFIRVRNAASRSAIAALVNEECMLTAQALGEREAEFARLKVEGIHECAELLVAVMAPDDGTIFGRRTMPEEMALCSVACAIQNLWLAARAEELGMGWVSLFDPVALAALLGIPDGGKPIAVLCLGPVPEFYSAPMLQLEQWRTPQPLHEMLFENSWGYRAAT